MSWETKTRVDEPWEWPLLRESYEVYDYIYGYSLNRPLKPQDEAQFWISG